MKDKPEISSNFTTKTKSITHCVHTYCLYSPFYTCIRTRPVAAHRHPHSDTAPGYRVDPDTASHPGVRWSSELGYQYADHSHKTETNTGIHQSIQNNRCQKIDREK